MKRLIASSLALFMVAAAPASAETVKLVTGNEYKPFTDESLPAGGMVTDIVRTAYKNAGHDPEIEFLPWRRGEKMMARGRFVATFPYVKTEERLEKYAYSEPVFIAEEVPIVNKGNAGSISSYADLEGKTLCLPVGYQATSPRVQKMIKNGKIEEEKPRNISSCYKMLQAGRIDFIALEQPQAVLEARETLGSTDAVSFENLVLSQSELHLIFDKGGENTAQEIETFNAALKALQDSGEYEKIVEEHLGQ